MALLTNILFQSQKKLDILKEAHRVLKVGGELVIVDWDPTSMFGSKETGWKFSKEECQQIASELVLILIEKLLQLMIIGD